jgi:hypothetical protein
VVGVCLPEALEHMGQELGPDADTGVADAYFDVAIHALQPYAHPAVFRRELDRIRQQVPDDLLQPAQVAGNRSNGPVERLLEADALGVGCGPTVSVLLR